MSDSSIDKPSEHEQRVAEEERARTGMPPEAPEGSSDEATGGTPRPTYGEELEAEQEGRRADEPEPGADESEAPIDSAYQPRTG